MEVGVDVTYENCPECGATIPVNTDYVKWCDRCGWNMQPLNEDKEVGRFARIYAAAGVAQSERLLEAYKRASALQPRLTLAKVGALLLAAVVHLVTVLMVVLGLFLVIAFWPNLFAIFGGLLCLGLASELRPRFAKIPKDRLSPDAFPAIHRLVDDVARGLQATPPEAIVVGGDFNAALGQAGWRGKPVLYLGLPLWAILDDEERLALLGHELAHGVNGDGRRHVVVATALDSLAHWYRLVHPGFVWGPRAGLAGLILIPFNLVRMLLAGLIWLDFYLLVYLLARDSQRAEYLADYLAARTAGSDATIRMIDKLHLYKTIETTVRRVALAGEGEMDLFMALRERVACVPDRERERIRRVRKLEGARLDLSHPPTVNRLELLHYHYIAEPALSAAALPFAAVAEETAQLEKVVQQKLVASVEHSLY